MFKDIHHSAFAHDRDRAATASLKAVPGLEQLVQGMISWWSEDRWRLEQHQTALKLGPAQYPSLYKMVTKAVEQLDTPMPEVFLDTGYEVNAFAFGFNRYTVTLYSGLVDLMDDDQIMSVIGHEIGHIACDHMTYKTMANLLHIYGDKFFRSWLGPGRVLGLPLMGMQLALQNWSRAAEFSCDRAALLVVQDPDKVAGTLAGLAGKSSRFASEFNLEAVITQADDIRQDVSSRGSGVLGSGLDMARQLLQTHPDPVLRVTELLSWAKSDQYKSILAGDYPRRSEMAEQVAGDDVELDWKQDGV